MTVLQSSISQTGIAMPATLVSPLQKAMPRKRTPMNFCPSCAPCMKLIAAAPKICAYLKNTLVLRLSMPAQTIVIRRQTHHPLPKPSARLMTRP